MAKADLSHVGVPAGKALPVAPPDPARIASGLTWQVRELIQAVPEAGTVYPPLPPACIRGDLVEHITNWSDRPGWRLTLLGRAVRAALADARAAQGAQDRGNQDGDDK